MKSGFYSHEQLVNVAQYKSEDIEQINQRRRQHNRLGYGYQLAFVRLTNRFPAQQPFEIFNDVLSFTSAQLNIPPTAIDAYANRQPTNSEHQEHIRKYLGLRRYDEKEALEINKFVFEEACRLEHTSALLAGIERFFREHDILKPSEDTLRRLIVRQRKNARRYIFNKIAGYLPETLGRELDELATTKKGRSSVMHWLKIPPGIPSPKSVVRLTTRLERIRSTGVLELDLSLVQDQLGHTKPEMTRRYAKRSSKSLADALEARRGNVITIETANSRSKS